MTRIPWLGGALVVAGFAFCIPFEDVSAQRAVQVRPSSDIVWIEGGWFRRGTSREELEIALQLCARVRPRGSSGRCVPEMYAQEFPSRRVYVSRFGIGRHEVTNDEWRACVRDAACAPSRTPENPRVGQPRMPVTGVRWQDAANFCAWRGGRLPTETEWERAARGPSSRVFPWGRVYNDRLANHGDADGPDPIDGHELVAPVGSYPLGASPDGVLDMAGNVWEWTADLVDDGSTWAEDVRIDPQGADSGGARVARGGAWSSSPDLLRSATRIGVPAGLDQPDLGFRCAFDGRVD